MDYPSKKSTKIQSLIYTPINAQAEAKTLQVCISHKMSAGIRQQVEVVEC